MAEGGQKRGSARVSEVVVLTTAMLTFISFWRAAAIVLCDLASTAYYIGGIVEQAIGKAAPWYILGVMLFSYAVRSVYIESCSMFIRGGVYKVVKEAMGGTLAKISAAALMFDYVLTGPISTVSAGQYLAGLLNAVFPHLRIGWHLPAAGFSMAFAIACTLYFWRQNIRGIEESSDKALKIMQLTTVMGVVMILWCGCTLWVRGAHLPPFTLRFSPEALGWTVHFGWLRPVGAIGVVLAFGHSLLAMSGEESLAQVYREIEAPKIKNLEKAGFLIFAYSMLLTSLVSFFAVMIIPDAVRIPRYGDNLLAGLAMSVVGPHMLRLVFQAFVVSVGVLILSGAANTSIVGSNGVLNRLAEDGVLADWFRWLHPRYGTTHRMINLVVGLQIATILLCRGDVYLLGEAYAFGVVWSFVFNVLAVIILRFKDKSEREFKVPLNVSLGSVEVPVGLALILLVLFSTALMNLLSKKMATMWGVSFTALFYAGFYFSERMTEHKASDHREKLNLRNETDVAGILKEVDRPERILVAIKNPSNVHVLDQVLDSVDADTTDVVVMHARIAHNYMLSGDVSALDPDSELLFTKVIELAEKHGKHVIPLLTVSNDPLFAVAQAAQSVGAREVVMGVSGVIRAEDQIERLAMAMGALNWRPPAPVKVKVIWAGGKRMEAELG
jgi:amino acid transporter